MLAPVILNQKVTVNTAQAYQTFTVEALQPPTSYTFQLSGVNAAGTALATPTAWSVNFEGSLDGIGWTAIVTHVSGTNVNGSSVSQATTQPNKQPFLYFRFNVISLTLSPADHLILTAVGAV